MLRLFRRATHDCDWKVSVNAPLIDFNGMPLWIWVLDVLQKFQANLYTEKSFLNLVKSNQIWLVIALFLLIRSTEWNQWIVN